MPETLVIRLPEQNEQQAEYLLVDHNGAPLGEAQTDSLESAAELSAGRRVIGLAPASDIYRTRADVPLRNKNRIRQALPFALEDQLARDLEGQHFAFGNRDKDGLIPVAVANEDRVAEWLEQFQTAGVSPDAIYAESDGLVPVPSTLTVLVDGTKIIIRDADGAVSIADPETLETVLELVIEQRSEAIPVVSGTLDEAGEPPVDDNDELTVAPVNVLVYSNEADYERHGLLWDNLRVRVDSLDVRILSDGALPRLASHVINSGGVNLLQGTFAPRRELPVEWRQWRIPGLLIGGLIVLLLLRAGVDLWQLSSAETALDEAASTLLMTTFADGDSNREPWSQLRSRLGNVDSEAPLTGPGFAEAIDALSAAYAKAANVNLQALSYRDGKLDVQLSAPSVESLDRIRQEIAAADNLDAEIQSANPDDDGIKGRLKITVTPPEGGNGQ
jgi:general secretion pathway protein L